MQSSATVACRAGVMLVCLIAIPGAALFGTKLPDMVKELLNRDWDPSLLASLFPDRNPVKEAASLGPSVSAPPWRDPSNPGDLVRSPDEWRADPTGVGTGRTVRAGYDAPIEPDSGGIPSSGPGTAGLASCPDPPPLVPVGMATADERRARRSERLLSVAPAKTGMAPPQSLQANSEAVAVQQRLRDLGAAYYALETWGAQGRLFRFHARMSLDAGSARLRHFEAVDTDPVRAMVAVLAQVEDWRVVGLGPETEGSQPRSGGR